MNQTFSKIWIIVILSIFIIGGIFAWQYWDWIKFQLRPGIPMQEAPPYTPKSCIKNEDCGMDTCQQGKDKCVEIKYICENEMCIYPAQTTEFPSPPYKCVEGKCRKEVVEDETADWQTYRNEEYGFEIQYPENWIFNQDVMSFNFSSGKIIKGSDEFNCSLNVALARKGANAEYINSLPKEKWQRSEIDMNGKSAIKLVAVDSPIKAYYFLEDSGEYSFQIYHGTTQYITNQEGYKVALGFVYNQECMDIFNQMLSTFRFLE